MKVSRSLVLCGTAFFPSLALAQNSVTVAPLAGFGVNGYIAPSASTGFLSTTEERGLAFNPLGIYDGANSAQFGGGDLYTTAATTGVISILSAATGAVEGTLGSPSNFTAATRSIDSIAVAADGAIYVSNLTTNSSTTAYKIYEFANEAAGTGTMPVGPTVAYSGTAGTSARLGDDLAVYGTGTSTLLASGEGAGSPQNGYVITSITAPTGNSSTAVQFSAFTGHDLSSDITFAGTGNSVLGSSAQIPGTYRDTTYAGTTGTLVATPTLPNTSGTGEHLLSYDVVDGVPILADQSTGDGHVSFYDDTNPAAPVLLLAGNAPAGETGSNGNATGEVVFGSVYNTNQVNVYTLSSGEGIAAYTLTVSVPEPASIALLGLAVPALLARRRRV